MSNRLAAARLSASARSTSILQSTELSLPLFYFISVHENKFYTFSPFFPGGSSFPQGFDRYCHTGRHIQGNAEVLLRHNLQAGGQHQRRGLDGVPPWQEPQGRALNVFISKNEAWNGPTGKLALKWSRASTLNAAFTPPRCSQTTKVVVFAREPYQWHQRTLNSWRSLSPSKTVYEPKSWPQSWVGEKGNGREEEIERGGEPDKQEQWSPLCALIWNRYLSSFSA